MKTNNFLKSCSGLIGLLLLSACDDQAPNTYDTPWTVYLKSEKVTYTLRVPFGALYLYNFEDIDEDNRSVVRTSTEMEWDSDSEKPYALWRKEQLDANPDLDTDLVAKKFWFHIGFTDPSTDSGKLALGVYFEGSSSKSYPADAPYSTGLIWNNTAERYEQHAYEYILIKTRDSNDASMIECSKSAIYCNLRGARLTPHLKFQTISIPKDDLQNWRSYQEKAIRLFNSTLVSSEIHSADDPAG
ncbi:hypothetical protein [Allohahella marinimesophila]|uniref:Uncharacterized protein n=1 Tax=Allohahella marinimesophila TaxID=1054972 RepID=A0ABP7PRU1_9GAMM